MSVTTGRIAWIYEDCYDIDLICGVKYLSETNADVLAQVAMTTYDPAFPQKVKPGDILVAGVAFGYGHPHPQGMKAMRALGIHTIIAKSFARVLFKNEVSAGMTLLPCALLPDDLEVGESLAVDLNAWTMTRVKTGEIFPLDTIPPVEQEMIRCKGIANYFKSKKG